MVLHLSCLQFVRNRIAVLQHLLFNPSAPSRCMQTSLLRCLAQPFCVFHFFSWCGSWRKRTAIRLAFVLNLFVLRCVPYTDVHLAIFSLFQGIPHNKGRHFLYAWGPRRRSCVYSVGHNLCAQFSDSPPSFWLSVLYEHHLTHHDHYERDKYNLVFLALLPTAQDKSRCLK